MKTFAASRRACMQAMFVATTIAMLALPFMAAADPTYPSKPIQLIVSFPPGGGGDVLARLLAPRLEKELGQSVVVVNKPGAGGNIGAGILARSPADGYTIGLMVAQTVGINPSLYKDLGFKASDFDAVTSLTKVTNVLVVNADFPATSVKELIEIARKEPVSYASTSPGSVQHLVAEMFRLRTGVQFLHVPYQGGGPAVRSVVAGETKVLFADPLASIPNIQAGRLRPLGVTALKRLSALPDVPTISEMGVADFEGYNWQGIMVPAGTPRPIIDRLNKAFNNVISQPDISKRLTDLGYETVGSTPEGFAQFVADENVKWKRVVVDANITVD